VKEEQHNEKGKRKERMRCENAEKEMRVFILLNKALN